MHETGNDCDSFQTGLVQLKCVVLSTLVGVSLPQNVAFEIACGIYKVNLSDQLAYVAGCEYYDDRQSQVRCTELTQIYSVSLMLPELP